MPVGSQVQRYDSCVVPVSGEQSLQSIRATADGFPQGWHSSGTWGRSTGLLCQACLGTRCSLSSLLPVLCRAGTAQPPVPCPAGGLLCLAASVPLCSARRCLWPKSWFCGSVLKCGVSAGRTKAAEASRCSSPAPVGLVAAVCQGEPLARAAN